MKTNTIYIVSPFLRIIKNGQVAFIWHSLFGNPKIVSIETLEFIHKFENRIDLNLLKNLVNKGANKKAIYDLIKNFFLIPKGFDERKLLNKKNNDHNKDIISGKRIKYLGLIMSETCNFDCIYCIHFNNLIKSGRIKSSKKFMNFNIAKEAIDYYLSNLSNHNKKIANINFGGGEPLLAWETILRIIKYCKNYFNSKFIFRFSINTNASLITADIANLLKQYNVKIATSLDGLENGNNSVRITRSKKGTFDLIINGFNNLSNAGYPIDGFSITINQLNFFEINESIIDWALDRGMKEVRVDIDIIGMVNIDIKEIIKKIIRLRSYALKKGINMPGFWLRTAENLYKSILRSSVAFCGGIRGNSICVNPSGYIYMCGYSNIKLGDVSNIKSFCDQDSIYSNFIRDHSVGNIDMCKGCMIEGQCGGCQITREFALSSNNGKLERMCDFYRQMTLKILKEQVKNFSF